jgi:hypothetical protein
MEEEDRDQGESSRKEGRKDRRKGAKEIREVGQKQVEVLFRLSTEGGDKKKKRQPVSPPQN